MQPQVWLAIQLFRLMAGGARNLTGPALVEKYQSLPDNVRSAYERDATALLIAMRDEGIAP